MAVQKSKKSRAKREMRRSHHQVRSAPYSIDPVTGETHFRHHITKTGYYKGKKLVDVKIPVEEEEEEET